MEDKLSLNKLSSYHKEYLFFHYFCIVTFKINIMRFYQITPNLSISDDSNFGNYDHKIIYELLTSISFNFSKHLNLISSSVPPCRITYINTNPRCSNIMSERWIFLHVSQDYWCQWIYQFAHEYCHHLINGAMSDDIIGLIWFEESICELSSMYHLHQLSTQWSISNDPIKLRYVPALHNYLHDLISKQPQLFSDALRPGFLALWEQILSEPICYRDYYNVLAAKMFPLFVENPSLWKIILHFGDMRKWGSLQELFDYLQRNATPDYSDSLNELQSLLLS